MVAYATYGAWVPRFLSRLLYKGSSLKLNLTAEQDSLQSKTHVDCCSVSPLRCVTKQFSLLDRFTLTLLLCGIAPSSILTTFTVKSSSVVLTVKTFSSCCIANIRVVVTLTP